MHVAPSQQAVLSRRQLQDQVFPYEKGQRPDQFRQYHEDDAANEAKLGNDSETEILSTSSGNVFSASTEGGDNTNLESNDQIEQAEVPTSQAAMMSTFSAKDCASSHKKHKCSICSKRFTRPSSLQTHIYSHTGEKRKTVFSNVVVTDRT